MKADGLFQRSNSARPVFLHQPSQNGNRDLTSIVVVALLLATSGNPAVIQFDREVWIFGFAAAVHAIYLIRPRSVNPSSLWVPVAFAIIGLSHIISFGQVAIAATLGTVLLIWSTLLATSIAPQWTRYFVRAMCVLSFMSLCFQAPVWLGFDPRSLSIDLSPNAPGRISLGLHTYMTWSGQGYRNAGPFWEPGAFAGYLALGIAILLFGSDFSPRDKRRYFVVLTTTLATTQSTGGIIGFGAILYLWQLHRLLRVRSNALAIFGWGVGLLILAYVGLWAYAAVPFLGDKLQAELLATQRQLGTWQISRIGNLVYDLDFISQRPLFGWSASPETRTSVDSGAMELAQGQGNGLSGLLVRYGLAGATIFVSAVVAFGRARFSSTRAAVFFVATVCLLLSYEQFLNFPIFMALMFSERTNILRC